MKVTRGSGEITATLTVDEQTVWLGQSGPAQGELMYQARVRVIKLLDTSGDAKASIRASDGSLLYVVLLDDAREWLKAAARAKAG